jgi:tetratricopeptide (TPR) repeat protein
MAEDDHSRASADSGTWAALGAASRAKADAWLEEQTTLARLQAQDLRREDKLRHWSLIVRHTSDVLKVAFELAVAGIALAILIGIGAALWKAAHDNSLIIDAFSVPPDMASRGLTGQAVAAQLQDKLTAMQDATDSGRPAASYANNWGNDIKVEIPNTGVSIGEFYRYLALWLGHQTHITGEVFRAANGITVTARCDGEGASVAGREADFDVLMQRAAEAIYQRTQPYRYAVFVNSPGREEYKRSRQMLVDQTTQGSAIDRAWAHIGLGSLDDFSDPVAAPSENHIAASLAPDLPLPWQNLAFEDGVQGHDELALSDERRTIAMLAKAGDADMTARARAISLVSNQAGLAFVLCDFENSLHLFDETAQLPDYSGIVESAHESIALDLALLHRAPAARQAWAALTPSDEPFVRNFRAIAHVQLDYWMDDWAAVVAEAPAAEHAIEAMTAIPGVTQTFVGITLRGQVWPYIATAKAMTGNFAGAHALIDKTPGDCYTCVRNRAVIDAAQKNWNGAAYWFARAVGQAPSIPLGYSQWGAMLMAKGDFDGAIAKFTLANQKGPHFADPLEMWGEALIAKNRSDLALAKFEEANKYAPNWGRLHLKWGEALLWSGDKAGAQKQFAVASGPDLSMMDKSELARIGAAHG